MLIIALKVGHAFTLIWFGEGVSVSVPYSAFEIFQYVNTQAHIDTQAHR